MHTNVKKYFPNAFSFVLIYIIIRSSKVLRSITFTCAFFIFVSHITCANYKFTQAYIHTVDERLRNGKLLQWVRIEWNRNEYEWVDGGELKSKQLFALAVAMAQRNTASVQEEKTQKIPTEKHSETTNLYWCKSYVQ